MTTKKRFIAEVPTALQQQNIRWLVLEKDEAQTGGWYVYSHQSLQEGADFDSWHQTLAEAEREAAQRWGIDKGDWREVC
jgi:hypothetical protein